MLYKPRSLILVGIVLALSVGVFLVLTVVNSSSPVRASAIIGNANATSEDILAQLGPEKALRITSTYYVRLGPSASKVAASDWPMAEEAYQESWLVFGADGLLADERALARDANGFVWQETVRVGNKSVSRNFYNGETISDAWRTVSADDYVRALAARMSHAIPAEQEATTKGKLFGLDSAIFEVTRSISPSEVISGDTGFSVPDLSDLRGQTLVSETEMVVQNPFLARRTTYVVDEEGNRHLVEELKIASVEVIELAQVPDSILNPPSWLLGE